MARRCLSRRNRFLNPPPRLLGRSYEDVAEQPPSRSGYFFDPATPRFAAKTKLALTCSNSAFAGRSAPQPGRPEKISNSRVRRLLFLSAFLYPAANEVKENLRYLQVFTELIKMWWWIWVDSKR